MKNDLDSKMILRVFEYIQQHGEIIDDLKCVDGIFAYTDYDGYTIYLKSNTVTLTLGFHNTYHLEYDAQNHKESFYQSVNRLNHIALSAR